MSLSSLMANVSVRMPQLRIRSWLSRLPLFTRVVFFVITLLHLVGLFVSSLATFGALTPSEVSLLQNYRLTSYPFLHAGIFQLIFTLIALVPLLERFEAEHGTLVSVALFMGPLTQIPAILYILIDHVILRSDHSVVGASVWVYLLLACEAVKIYRANPTFTVGDYQIPTWTSALVVILFINFLIPHTSLLAHLCGAVVGYGFELGYLKFLKPPERVLRWIEARFNLMGRLPRYVSVDANTYGRYGVLDVRPPVETTPMIGLNLMRPITPRPGQD